MIRASSLKESLERNVTQRLSRDHSEAECLRIAVINNMPDAALKGTEMQFRDLIAAAAGNLDVRIKLYSLPEIVRSDRARQHLKRYYSDLRDLSSARIDAVIITGAEPLEAELTKERYWRTLVDLIDWSARNTVSTILSCLAAHASVFRCDGVKRHRLVRKTCGVFEERIVRRDPLTLGAPQTLRMPHSHWNELRENELVSCGYCVLTKSEMAGVGLFAKEQGSSLFVHFQGHPEYAAHTLLKEYRRDVRRFITGESDTYPSMPFGYFDNPAMNLLRAFEQRALSGARGDLLAQFPEAAAVGRLRDGWHGTAVRIYRNWLKYILSRKDRNIEPLCSGGVRHACPSGIHF